jgi:hypothetical protein
MDFDSKIKMMNDEEFIQHVRDAQQLRMDEEQKYKEKKKRQ